MRKVSFTLAAIALFVVAIAIAVGVACVPSCDTPNVYSKFGWSFEYPCDSKVTEADDISYAHGWIRWPADDAACLLMWYDTGWYPGNHGLLAITYEAAELEGLHVIPTGDIVDTQIGEVDVAYQRVYYEGDDGVVGAWYCPPAMSFIFKGTTDGSNPVPYLTDVASSFECR